MHLILTVSNSQKSFDYHWLLIENSYLSSNKSYLWRLTFPFTICYYFENDFYVRKWDKIFWSFYKNFEWFSDIKIIFKIIIKMKANINFHTKIKGTSFPIKHWKNSRKFGEKLHFLSHIPNLSHIHQLSLTYFSNFEAYFCSIFHFYWK